jgi:hypothetical protein
MCGRRGTQIDSGKRWADAYALKSTLREAADALSPAERRHLDLDTIAAFSIGRAHLNRSTVKALAIGVEFEVRASFSQQGMLSKLTA